MAATSERSAEIYTLMSQGMGPCLHWFPADVQVSRLAAVMTGMANHQGGVILLGIAPRSAQVLGIHDLQAALDLVFQAALLVDPPLVLPMPQTVQAGAIGASVEPLRTVLMVSIPSGLPNVYSLDGRFLGREGAQTNPLPARRLRQLLMERGAVQFEAQAPPGVAVDELDEGKIAAYLRALDLPGDEASEEVLLRRGCLRPVSEAAAGPALRPTYAGLLLFGKQPQRWLSSAGILAARFAGTTLTDHFIKQDIQGSLPEQLRLAEAFIRDNLPRLVRMEGLEHVENTAYPLEALREVLVNAVAHRDYNVQGDMIHINIFTDRIEITSPGGLPGPMTLDNLLEARFSRNPVILQVLADLGFVERLGYGLNRVMEAMRSHRLRPPRFEEAAGAFRVTLFAPAETLPTVETLAALDAYRSLDLNPRQQQALVFMQQNRRITNRDYQDLCPDVHPETLRRDLAGLVERGLAIKVGDKRSTYYILKRT
jgi:ATP-dependent DNA helicase RecG